MRLLALFFVVAAVAAEVIDIKKCDGVDENKCTIHEIRISPCANKNACRLKKGENAEVSFDYTPRKLSPYSKAFDSVSTIGKYFSADKVLNEVTYISIPWDEIKRDACQYTPCPVQEGKQQTYNASLHIGSKLPDGKYEFRWSVFDEKDEATACCFRAKVQLRK